jgi:hypothetical protein
MIPTHHFPFEIRSYIYIIIILLPAPRDASAL